MTNIHSHVKSLDHFDEFWNKKIDLCSSHFRNNITVAYLYNFNITTFLRSLSDSYLADTQPLNDLYMQKHTKYSAFTLDEFLASYAELHSFYANFQARKKTVTTTKLDQFVQKYNALDIQQKQETILPYTVDELFSLILSSFYPSVRFSIRNFFLDTDLVVFDKKTSSVLVRNFRPNNQNFEAMNKNSSFHLVNSFSSNSNDLKEVLSSISDLFDSLQKDNDYLEQHVNQLNQKIDKHDKEGMNGYLLTWH